MNLNRKIGKDGKTAKVERNFFPILPAFLFQKT